MIERYLKPEEVAEALRTTPGSLKYLRHVGTGPTYVKIGRRVLYPERALIEYLATCEVTPSETAAE